MTGNRQYTNDASALLAGTITSASTTIAVATGFGALFPSPSGTQYFIVALQDTSGNTEYVAITSRSTDNLTVAPVSAQFPAGGRAQEGTTAQGFTANLARVEIRLTAAQQAGLYEKDGDTLTGPMNGGNQTVTNMVLSTGVSMENASEIVNTPIRGKTATTANQITVPTDGVSRAQAGGLPIVCLGDPTNAFTVGMVMMFNGAPANLPAGWGVCDGTVQNGYNKPDLRDSFIIGAGLTYALGANGDVAIPTSSDSAGTPTINAVTLAVTNLPVHAHPFDYFAGSIAVIGIPGFAYNNGYMFEGTGSGETRFAFPGSNTGGGTAFTPTAPAMSGHAHTVEVGPFYALYFAIYVGT
jgi:hypothetical protein